MTTARFWIVLTCASALLATTLVVRSIGLVGPDAGVERADLAYTLKDMDGNDVRLSDFSGKPLIINLWATWCEPCRLEMPQLVELSAKYKARGLTIVGISVDDTPDQIRAFATAFRVDYPLLVGRDRDDVLAALGYFSAVPMTVFVKADGTVTHRLPGIATTASWERRIEALF